MNILSVLIGGAIGSLLRYATSTYSYKIFGTDFPWGTLAVNLIGALMIGFLWGMSDRFEFSTNTRNFIFVGILGGFTTFSSFALENFNLIKGGEMNLALINIGVQNIAGLALVYIGFICSKLIFKSI